MTLCARCNRNVTAPIFAGGMAFGSTCYRKVAGTKPRRARKAKEEAAPADPRQRDLFAEDLAYATRVDTLLSSISLEMQ